MPYTISIEFISSLAQRLEHFKLLYSEENNRKPINKIQHFKEKISDNLNREFVTL